MVQIQKSRSGGGARKVGRDKKKGERYKLQGKREKNKIKKILHHLKNHPDDYCAIEALSLLDPLRAKRR